MATNPFKHDYSTPPPKRNSFDLSFSNNLSFNIGDLVPVFCKEVIPGDTFNIDSAFGLRLMTMAFPVQTRMRAHLSFFYVRNRNLWKNWKKFLRNLDSDGSVVMPYIAGDDKKMKEFFASSTLADYLGCPTFTVQKFSMEKQVNPHTVPDGVLASFTDSYGTWTSSYSLINKSSFRNEVLKTYGVFRRYLTKPGKDPYAWFDFRDDISDILHDNGNVSVSWAGSSAPTDLTLHCRLVIYLNDHLITGDRPFYDHSGPINYDYSFDKHYIGISDVFSLAYNTAQNSFDGAFTGPIYDTIGNGLTIEQFFRLYVPGKYRFGIIINTDSSFIKNKQLLNHLGNWCFTFDYTSQSNNNSAYNGDLKINALAFRAYESIYNAIYRNTQNDPFIKNGKPEYDEFITTDADGADTTPYKLEHVYYEKDFLTTALPSPQQGNAPLLGFSQNAGSQFSDNSSNAYYSLPVTVSDDKGTKITHPLTVAVNKSNKNISFVTTPNSSQSAELQGVLTALNNAAGFGISINDLRNVNSLQRWLEKAIRSGYRYRDVIQAHFGIEISLRELDMPEFLGGISEEVNVQGITQTSESNTTPLGWQAGQGGVFAQSKNRISKYCDEHGFIIGLMYVAPIPSYSQLLPKHFTKFGPLDYFDPDFAHIGMQPIKYREVCPLQANNSGLSLETVFGYQRAWYDYLASTDEVHAEFRESLSDFIITRVFDDPPKLSGDFLRVDNKDANNIFVVQTPGDHKIYGQVYFDVVAERPIPLYDEPRLE